MQLVCSMLGVPSWIMQLVHSMLGMPAWMWQKVWPMLVVSAWIFAWMCAMMVMLGSATVSSGATAMWWTAKAGEPAAFVDGDRRDWNALYL